MTYSHKNRLRVGFVMGEKKTAGAGIASAVVAVRGDEEVPFILLSIIEYGATLRRSGACLVAHTRLRLSQRRLPSMEQKNAPLFPPKLRVKNSPITTPPKNKCYFSVASAYHLRLSAPVFQGISRGDILRVA